MNCLYSASYVTLISTIRFWIASTLAGYFSGKYPVRFPVSTVCFWGNCEHVTWHIIDCNATFLQENFEIVLSFWFQHSSNAITLFMNFLERVAFLNSWACCPFSQTVSHLPQLQARYLLKWIRIAPMRIAGSSYSLLQFCKHHLYCHSIEYIKKLLWRICGSSSWTTGSC